MSSISAVKCCGAPVNVRALRLGAACRALKTEPVPLNTLQLVYFGKLYLSSPADALSPLASPLRDNLHGVSPATIINAEIGPLRDDGALYAAKLRAAHVPVTRTVYSGMTYEFFSMSGSCTKRNSRSLKQRPLYELHSNLTASTKGSVGNRRAIIEGSLRRRRTGDGASAASSGPARSTARSERSFISPIDDPSALDVSAPPSLRAPGEAAGTQLGYAVG